MTAQHSLCEWIHSIRLPRSRALLGPVDFYSLIICVGIKVSLPKCNLMPRLLGTPHHRARLQVSMVRCAFQYMYHSLRGVHDRLQRAMAGQRESQVVEYRNSLADNEGPTRAMVTWYQSHLKSQSFTQIQRNYLITMLKPENISI